MTNPNINLSPQKIYEKVAGFPKLSSDKQEKYSRALLSKKGNILINTIDPITQENALHIAIKNGDKMTSLLLVALKINRDHPDKNGKKPYELELGKLSDFIDIFTPLPTNHISELKSSKKLLNDNKEHGNLSLV